MHSLKHLGLPQICPCSVLNMFTPGGPSTLERPNPGLGSGGVSVAQRGPALVLHLPLNMLEVDSLETLSLALLEEEKKEEKSSSQRLEGAETCPGSFLF